MRPHRQMMWRYTAPQLRFSVFRRGYRVLAIESSCDDACVALLERSDGETVVVDQDKATLDSSADGGIIPTSAYTFQQQTIAPLVQRLLTKHNLFAENRPDLVCATRGPGLAGALSAGLQVAKGLSVAWNRPLVGVHHMLGHLMMPTVVTDGECPPKFPFISLLCSGGHTMLVLLESITKHRVLANTIDIACGDSLDKCARHLGMEGTMLGKELEKYVDSMTDAEKTEYAEISTEDRSNRFSFQLGLPLRKQQIPDGPVKVNFAFASFLSLLQAYKPPLGIDEETVRKFLAFKTHHTIFTHIVDRIKAVFRRYPELQDVQDLVVSGGVAANKTLRTLLTAELAIRNPHMKLHLPPPSLCTDNAVMIGIAGIELFENAGVTSDLSITPFANWPLDQLMDVDGWKPVP